MRKYGISFCLFYEIIPRDHTSKHFEVGATTMFEDIKVDMLYIRLQNLELQLVLFIQSAHIYIVDQERLILTSEMYVRLLYVQQMVPELSQVKSGNSIIHITLKKWTRCLLRALGPLSLVQGTGACRENIPFWHRKSRTNRLKAKGFISSISGERD